MKYEAMFDRTSWVSRNPHKGESCHEILTFEAEDDVSAIRQAWAMEEELDRVYRRLFQNHAVLILGEVERQGEVIFVRNGGSSQRREKGQSR